jgi:hypothetical protein
MWKAIAEDYFPSFGFKRLSGLFQFRNTSEIVNHDTFSMRHWMENYINLKAVIRDTAS